MSLRQASRNWGYNVPEENFTRRETEGDIPPALRQAILADLKAVSTSLHQSGYTRPPPPASPARLAWERICAVFFWCAEAIKTGAEMATAAKVLYDLFWTEAPEILPLFKDQK